MGKVDQAVDCAVYRTARAGPRYRRVNGICQEKDF